MECRQFYPLHWWRIEALRHTLNLVFKHAKTYITLWHMKNAPNESENAFSNKWSEWTMPELCTVQCTCSHYEIKFQWNIILRSLCFSAIYFFHWNICLAVIIWWSIFVLWKINETNKFAEHFYFYCSRYIWHVCFMSFNLFVAQKLFEQQRVSLAESWRRRGISIIFVIFYEHFSVEILDLFCPIKKSL